MANALDLPHVFGAIQSLVSTGVTASRPDIEQSGSQRLSHLRQFLTAHLHCNWPGPDAN